MAAINPGFSESEHGVILNEITQHDISASPGLIGMFASINNVMPEVITGAMQGLEPEKKIEVARQVLDGLVNSGSIERGKMRWLWLGKLLGRLSIDSDYYFTPKHPKDL